MTPKEIQALDYIRGCITRGGFSPTLDGVAQHVGASKTTAHGLVSALVDAGYLTRTPGKKRGLELVGVTDLRATDSEALRAELARRGETPGALSRPERRAVHGREVTCAADCCTVIVRWGHPFCITHWRAIGPETQRALFDAKRVAELTGFDADLARLQDAFGRAKAEAEGSPWTDREAA